MSKPTLLETAHREWAACYDKLLAVYVRETAEPEFSDWFIADVKRLSDIDLEAQCPLDHDLDGILNEIRFFHIIIEHAYLLIWEIIRPDSIFDVEYLARERPLDPRERPADSGEIDFDDDDEEYDPYCEDVYHEDDPRLYERTDTYYDDLP